jgi:hypothetical protein
MSNELFIRAVACVVAVLGIAMLGACFYYASKELSKLTSDVLRGWTDD